MESNIHNLNECSRCKKILSESRLMLIRYWKCDNCLSKEIEKLMDEGSKGLFFKGEAARKIVKGLRERAENNGPLSPNEFESFIDSYEK